MSASSEKIKITDRELVKKGKRGFFSVIFGRSTVVILLLLVQIFSILFAFTFLGRYLYLAAGGYAALSAVNLMFVLNTDDDPTVKLSWSIIIGLVPVLGIPLYWLVRKDVGHRVEKGVMSYVIKESLQYVPDQSGLIKRLENEKPRLAQLTGYTANNGGYTVYEHSGVRYFALGEDKMEALCEALSKAKHFIFMEYFIINRGAVWERILHILIEKAADGVEVRLMYDGTQHIASLPHDYPERLRKLGIKCKVFSPIKPFLTVAYNNRDHRKVVVVDGDVAFTGGVNLADEYMNLKTVHGHWKDTAIEVRGEAVAGFTLMFLQMWNSTEKDRIYEPYMSMSSKPAEGKGYIIPYADSPLDHEKVGEMVYMDIINNAVKYVYIMTPYLILDQQVLTALIFAAKRGVDVRILLPHIPDKKYAFALAKSHYRQLYDAGVGLYEYTPGFVHAKVFLSDDMRAVVGTINLDYRSLYLHFECAAYVEDNPVINDILADFNDCFEKSARVDDSMIKRTSIGYRAAGCLLKLIAPLM